MGILVMRGILNSFFAIFFDGLLSRFTFLREFSKNRSTIGSLAPSSRYLSAKMAKNPSVASGSSRQILEVGPGSGAITHHLYKSLDDGDHLTVVELNPNFANHTKAMLDRLHAKLNKRVSYEVIVASILSCDFSGKKFDLVICSLPFNNFKADLVKSIFDHMISLCAAGSEIRFYEYILLRRIKIWLFFGRLKNLALIENTLNHYIIKYGTSRDPVWLNFPPAMVYNLRIEKSQH
jgi:phospholipid N-methyltransferase